MLNYKSLFFTGKTTYEGEERVEFYLERREKNGKDNFLLFYRVSPSSNH